MKAPNVKLQQGAGYAEIYGKGEKGVQFNLLDPNTFEALHQPTYCKDFLTDVFYAETTGRPTDIWGFTWKQGQLPDSERKCELALRVPHLDLGDRCDMIQEFLNKWERNMEIPLSLVRPDLSGKLAVVQFDRAWTTRPVMISLLTLLMRLSITYDGTPVPKFIDKIAKNGNPYGKYDQGEIGKTGIVDLLERIYTSGEHPHPKQTFEQYKNPHGCHHSGGLIAFTTGKATG